jgi:elongation factor Ts
MSISAALVKELRERTGAGMMECKKALVAAEGDIEAAVDSMRKAGQAKADKRAARVAAEGLIGIECSGDGRAAAMVEVNCETDFVAKEERFQQFVADVALRVLTSQPADLEALAAESIAEQDGDTVDERRRELVARIGENITLRRLVRVECATGRVAAYLHGGRIGVVVAVAGGDAGVAKDVAMHVAASRPLCVSEEDMPSEVMSREAAIFKAQSEQSGKPPEIVQKMVAGRLKKFLAEVTLHGQPFVKNPDMSVHEYLSAAGATVERFARFEVGEGIEKRTENFAEEVMAQARGRAAE